MGKQQRGQLVQRLVVDMAFKRHDLGQGAPVIHPAPAIELRTVGGIQANAALTAHQPQQVPALLLTHAQRPGITAYEPRRQAVTQPITGTTDEPDMFGPEPYLLAEFAIQRLLRGFVALNAALRELPGVLPYTARPEEPPLPVAEDDPDVCPIPLGINHLSQFFGLRDVASLFHKGARSGKWINGPPAKTHIVNPVTIGYRTLPGGAAGTPQHGTPPLALALFDLDNTLLDGDSDYLWGQFLVERGILDGDEYARENLRFYREYQEGTLDIEAFLDFQLRPLRENDPEALYHWRNQFISDAIEPIVLPGARELLQSHRDSGHQLVIISATNRFITEPIATLLGADDLLCTEPELVDGQFTGRVSGEPCFQEGKITHVERWLDARSLALDDSWFYSDSRNDIPLLERVTHPVAVDPDPALEAHAAARGWRIISLR